MKLLLLMLFLVPYAISKYTNLKEKTLSVTSLEHEPYLMLNDKNGYEGYIVDLLEALSERLGFNYVINPVKDGRYGNEDKVSGKWNGMIGEVIEGAADMAVMDITVTAEREKAVDFTYPFMFSGIGLVYKKSLGHPAISSIEDLANNQDIHVGVYYGGSTYKFLKNSKDLEIQKLFDRLSGPSSKFLLKSNLDGVSAVTKMNGGLAFFMETPALKYALQNNCGLVQVGEELNQKGYGIVLPEGSPIRKDLNIAILELQEEGTLDQIRNKWFKRTGACEDDSTFDTLLAWMIGY